MSAAWIVVIILGAAIAFLFIAIGIACIMEVSGRESRREERREDDND